MKYLLVKTNNNWADEIDTEGFAIFTKEAYFAHLQKVGQALEEQTLTLYVGTNEEIEFESIEEYTKQIEVSEIDPFELALFRKHFKIELNEGKTNDISHYGLLTLFSDYVLKDQVEDNESWGWDRDEDDQDGYYPDDDNDETY